MDTSSNSETSIERGDSDSYEDIGSDPTSIDFTTDESYTYEQIYSLPDHSGRIRHLSVDDGYLYLAFQSAMYRLSPDGGTPINEQSIFCPTPYVARSIVYDEDSISMVYSPTQILRYIKSTGVFEKIAIPEEFAYYAVNLAADDERYYFTQTGCDKIVSMKRDGSDPIECSQERTGSRSGISSVAVGGEYAYCSGGANGSTDGKLYRCAKTGGNLTEVATIERADYVLNFQVGPMKFIDGKLYFIVIDPSRLASYNDLSVISDFSNENENIDFAITILSKDLTGCPGENFVYDETTQTFYCLNYNESLVMKYDVVNKKATHINVEELTGETVDFWIALDDNYLYWITGEGHSILRMRKF